VSTVVIVLDDRVDTEEARNIHLTLRHGVRVAGSDGEPVPPTVVSAGNRSMLLYAVGPDTARPKGEGLVVTVASQPGVHLAGVMGSGDAAPVVADRLARAGLDALLRPQTAGTGEVSLGWSAGAAPPPVRPPRPSRPPVVPPVGPGRPVTRPPGRVVTSVKDTKPVAKAKATTRKKTKKRAASSAKRARPRSR
jgi:hypothetical protein